MPRKKDEDLKIPEMITADKLFEEEKDVKILSTDTPIDELIGGGIRDNEVVEFYGEYGVGKTQISLTLAAKVAAENNDVIYVDCENTFRPKRIWQIAESRGYNPEEVLSRIYVARPESVAQQGRSRYCVGSFSPASAAPANLRFRQPARDPAG